MGKKQQDKITELEDYIDILQDALVAQQETSREYYEKLVSAVDCYDLMMWGLHRGWKELTESAKLLLVAKPELARGSLSGQVLKQTMDENPIPDAEDLDSMTEFFDKLVVEESGVPFAFTDMSGEELVEFLPGVKDFDAPFPALPATLVEHDEDCCGWCCNDDDDDEDGCGV